MADPRTYVAVAVGAALGGLCRYIITLYFVQRLGPGFPYGTLFINVTGSFLIGFIIELAQTRVLGIGPLVRIALTTGFLGGYTTFSSFAYEMFTLGSEREWSLAAVYGLGSVVLGVAACYAGMIVARLMTRSV
jgi:CrcB protein